MSQKRVNLRSEDQQCKRRKEEEEETAVAKSKKKFVFERNLKNGRLYVEEYSPIPFEKLSDDLKRLVMEKFDFRTWTKFRQCSAASHNAGDLLEMRLPLAIYSIDVSGKKLCFQIHRDHNFHRVSAIEDIPCRLEADRLDIEVINVDIINTESWRRWTVKAAYIQRLANYLKTLQIKATKLVFTQDVKEIPTETLCNLLENLNLTEIEAWDSEERYVNLFDQPYFQKMKFVKFETKSHISPNDQQFLSLRATTLYIVGGWISDEALNQFLKEWHTGQREVDKFIRIQSYYSIRSADVILSGLEACLEWSAEWHQYSILKDIPMEDIEDTDWSLYIMWRPRDIMSTFSLWVRKGVFFFAPKEPKEMAEHLFTKDNYQKYRHLIL